MALGFRGEALHQEDDDEAAENRRENIQSPNRLGPSLTLASYQMLNVPL